MLEGRKHSRTPRRFLAQMSAVRDPLVGEVVLVQNLSSHGVRVATEKAWEAGCHVDVKSSAAELRARARVVYCQPIGPRAFSVGLDLLTPEDGWNSQHRTAAKREND
jgi:hypothetical protein